MATTTPPTRTPRHRAAGRGRPGASDITQGGLAQLRYRGNGPKFIKVGGRVLYRWSDVNAYLDANTMTRTDDPRGPGVAWVT